MVGETKLPPALRRHRPLTQKLQHLAAGRIGEGLEDIAHVAIFIIMNEVKNYFDGRLNRWFPARRCRADSDGPSEYNRGP